jgi:threonine dehydrogenase-like Zn-dependent dehydrogenase
VVVECTGSPDGLAMAMKFVRPRGIIVLKSTVADTAGLDLAPIVVNEVTVVGSRCGPMDEAVAMLARGEVEVEPLVSGVFPLAEAPQALRAADRPESIKVLIRA